ncbi:unnamed protein product [Dicrocoelium dendriticum]|nr:unnamed protein product [Dicrocoelium dendriticum]
MFFNIARLDAGHSACSIICRNVKDAKLNISILIECRSDVIGFPGNDLAHPVMLKLKTRGQHLLQSQSVHKSINIITDRINGESDHCVTVTNVLSAESGLSRGEQTCQKWLQKRLKSRG